MQAENTGSIYDRCSCCLENGKYLQNFEKVHMKMLRKYLNLIITWDSSITPVICTGCVNFLHEAQRFREKVISSQRQLLDGRHDETMCFDTLIEAFQENEDRVKIEEETNSGDGHVISAGNLSPGIIVHTNEGAPFKTEDLNSEYLSDWDTLEDFVKNETEDTKIQKVKRKRKIRNCKIIRKKREKYDSESDTPISQIINKKCRLKRKVVEEQKTSSTSQESRQHSFVDNNKVRSNIILILKHSTIMPFRNNFKSTFKCFYCDKLYIPFKELKEHIEKEHKDVPENTISKTVRSLQNLIVTADISCLNCKLCNEEFKSIENLVEHLCSTHKMTYHETDKKPSHGILGVDLSTDTLKCHICNKEFAFFKNLSVHMNEHYGSFVCYVCGKKFLSEHRYKCHIFKAHANKETKCKHCGKTFSTEPSMAYHIRKEHLKRMIKCLKCPETFSLGQYVKRLNHMAEAHGIKKPVFKCDTCGREYANSGSLAAHKRYTHKRSKEHKCEICGYITVHNTVMKKHMDVHNGVKNYECDFCKKKFAKPYTLKLHLKIHLNDKRFVCSLCDAAFIQKNSLKSHLKSRHPDSVIDIRKL